MRIKGWKYFYRAEGWIKIISVITALLVLANDMGNFEHSASRLVCAVALLFSWMEITMLLSRFPEFGYYFQMFSTVALRVVKVINDTEQLFFKMKIIIIFLFKSKCLS